MRALAAVILALNLISSGERKPIHTGRILNVRFGQLDRSLQLDHHVASILCPFRFPIGCNFFKTEGLHLVVGFVGGVAVAVGMRGYTDPGNSQYFRLLVDVMPPGSRRVGCRTTDVRSINPEGVSGRARVCEYRLHRRLIVLKQGLSLRDQDVLEGEVYFGGAA